MKEEKLLGKIQGKKFLITLSCILIAIFLVIWIFLVKNVTTIKKLDVSNIKTETVSSYSFYIDELNAQRSNISNKKDYIEMSGWFAKNNTQVESVSLNIVLKNKNTGIYYLIPTYFYSREEVSSFINDGYDHQYSGFSIKIPYLDDLDNSDYEIYVLYTLNNEEKLVSLNTTLKTWGQS